MIFKHKNLNLFLIILISLLISGCGGTVQRSLKMYPIPEMPSLNITSSADMVSMPEKDFSDLTQYVIRLEGQLGKCNDQSRAFNE